MYKIRRVVLVMPLIVLLGLTAAAGRARAQQVLAWNEGKVPAIQVTPSAEEMRQEDEAHEKLCKTHPRRCGPVEQFLPPTPKELEDEAKKDPSYYQKPEPGHDTSCFHDPKTPPDNWVCIPDTWSWPNQPQLGHCYSNPANPSERRCAPLVSGD